MSKLKKLIMMANASDDQLSKYLTIEALEDNLTVSFSNPSQYSLNETDWTGLSTNITTPTINAGEKIYFKAEGLIPDGKNGIGTFSVSKRFNLSGTVMSMLFNDEAEGKTDLIEYDYTFSKLFTSTPVVNVSPNFLPATTLVRSCYNQMFERCTLLISAPKLPSTTLAFACYVNMFNGCTSLINAPKLSATKLADYCYSEMFNGCTSLVTAPELPATTLADTCYGGMFYNCISLVTAPELPATTLVSGCYANMFYGCSSLIIAPELPAEILTSGCYRTMFGNCTSLNYIKMLATDISAIICLNKWVNGVSTTGTFVMSKDATWNVIGASGIPEGWNTIKYPCISPAIVNSNDNITFYYNDGLYTPRKTPINLLSIFDYNQMMQLKPECDIEVCILSKGSLVESLYEWKHNMSLNDVIGNLNLYYEDITIVINKVIIESNDAGYYGYYY